MAADTVTPEVRSRMMAGIRGTNTAPELAIRSALHRRGFRFRLHCRDLPGRPDLVFPKYRAVIFVHGCFWHGHDCHLFRWPGTRREFWREKITSNRVRDRRNLSALLGEGWRVATIWECALKGKGRMDFGDLTEHVSSWLSGQDREDEVRGFV